MPVCSYLVHPSPGKQGVVMKKFEGMPECEAELSEKGELIILVTVSEDKESEKQLQENLKEIKEIDCLALSFGQVTN
jgi:nitrate reductase NapAB chaperone NapD